MPIEPRSSAPQADLEVCSGIAEPTVAEDVGDVFVDAGRTGRVESGQRRAVTDRADPDSVVPGSASSVASSVAPSIVGSSMAGSSMAGSSIVGSSIVGSSIAIGASESGSDGASGRP